MHENSCTTDSCWAGANLRCTGDFALGGVFGFSLRAARIVESFGPPSMSHCQAVASASVHMVIRRAIACSSCLNNTALELIPVVRRSERP